MFNSIACANFIRDFPKMAIFQISIPDGPTLNFIQLSVTVGEVYYCQHFEFKDLNKNSSTSLLF